VSGDVNDKWTLKVFWSCFWYFD